MKKVYGLILIAALLTSCNDSETTNETENVEVQDNVSVATLQNTIDTFCYLRTGGINDVDSAFIKLIIKGDSILWGDMRYLPMEKDARIGVLLPGVKSGNTVSLEWSCIQEGRKFSVPVSFILRNGCVYQKLWAYDDKGEEYLPDTSSYGLMYKPLQCSLYPVKVY